MAGNCNTMREKRKFFLSCSANTLLYSLGIYLVATLSSIDLSLFFKEDRHRTVLFSAVDLKFIPLTKLCVSLFSSRIDVDVIYNLPPVWNAENSSAK